MSKVLRPPVPEVAIVLPGTRCHILMRTSTAFAFFSFVSSALAQSTIYSPAGTDLLEGAGNSFVPWAQSGARRYQQIHADVGGFAKTILSLGFRADGGATANYTGVANCGCEILMSSGKPIAASSFTISNNYDGPTTTVFARKTFVFGPAGQSTAPGPNPVPAAMRIMLDAPYPYTGLKPLLWEAKIYSNAPTAFTTALMDGDVSSITIGITTTTGSGCIATGRTALMTHTANYADVAGLLMVNYQISNGVSLSPAVVALGTANLNLSLPGLCSNILTDLTTTISLGTTDAAGAVSSGMTAFSTFTLPNTVVGATIYSQAHVLDTARADALKVCNSDGRVGAIPTTNTTKALQVATYWNSLGGVTGVDARYSNTTSIGFALATEFKY